MLSILTAAEPLTWSHTTFSQRNWLFIAWMDALEVAGWPGPESGGEWSYIQQQSVTSAFSRGHYWSQFCLTANLLMGMRELSIPSVSLQTTASWVGVLTCCRAGRVCRGIWTWGDGLKPKVWRSIRLRVRLCSGVTTTPLSTIDWGQSVRKAAQQRTWERCGQHVAKHEAAVCPSGQDQWQFCSKCVLFYPLYRETAE